MRQARNYYKSWLSLGGNSGNVEKNFCYALQRLTGNGECRIKAISSLYRTAAWGKEDQPDFLNACIELETVLTPQALLQRCLQIEKEKKRERIEKWGPRSLDIDILFYEGYENKGVGDSILILPHPFIAERAFIVIPLAEISPNLSFEGMNFRQRAEIMKKKGRIKGIKKISESKYWYKL